MKNKKKFILFYLIIFFFYNIAYSNEEINYSSNTIKILEKGKIISGKGDVQILVGDDIFISSETFEYNKETGVYKIFNNVQFEDKIRNVKASGSEFILSTLDNKILSGKGDVQILVGDDIFISSETFEYNKETGVYKIFNNVQFEDKIRNIKASGSEFILSTLDNKILSKKKSKVIYNENYNIDLNNFEYDIYDKKISSDNFVRIKDNVNNYFELYEFLLDLKKNRFLGKEIKFIDNQRNKYFLNEVIVNAENDKLYGKEIKFLDNQQNKYLLNEVMINTDNDNLYGKELNIEFNKSLFGDSNNDPRLKAKSVIIKDQSSF